MPSSKRRAAPVIVEVMPDDVADSPYNMAPSTPPQAKAVRFPDKAEMVTGVTRPLTPTEAWSIYHFETHARSCPTCHDPYAVVSKGGRLCDSGHALAYDVAMHVYHRHGQVYSTTREDSRDIRVEVPPAYHRLQSLLKAMDRNRKHKRTVPIVTYEPTPKYHPSARRPAPAVQPVVLVDDYRNAYVEPARSDRDRRPAHKHHHKSTRYSTLVIGAEEDEDADERARIQRNDEKRGSLYERDTRRPRKEYRVEVREPSERKDRRRREDRQAIYFD